MKILRAAIKNFLIIGEANVNLDSVGLVLVQGINNDDSSANSNGAGKSSIVDAISWCLYGETARGESGDSVINDTAKKECSVTLEVLDGGVTYEISRYRKSKEFKNSLQVLNKNVAPPIILTKGNDRLTQEVVNKIVGCSYEVFVASVYSGQEMMPNLPGMTDKELKLIVEESAGISRLQEAHRLSTINESEVKSKLLSTKGLIDSTVKSIQQIDVELKESKEAQSSSALVKKTALDVAEKGLDGLRFELSEHIRLSSPTEKLEELENNIKRITNTITKTQKDEVEKSDEIAKNISKLERELAVCSTNFENKRREANSLKTALDDISNAVGTPCSECGKEYCEDDIADAKEIATKKFKASLIQLKSLKDRLTVANDALNIELEEQKEFKANLIDVSKLLSAQSKLRAGVEALRKEQHEIELVEQKLKSAENGVKKLTEDLASDPYEGRIEKLVGRLTDAKALLVDHELLFEKCETDLSVASAAVSVFGRAGIRAHILDTVTPFLNDRTAEYLGTLTDGNISASWSTLTKSAKGDYKERFSITVEKRNGSKSFRGLSGGEKRKVRLATAMALQDLVASRATKPIGFQFFDEIDDALDVSGLERLMTILEKRGRERGTVLVISHNDLSGWISNEITIVNNGGISTIM